MPVIFISHSSANNAETRALGDWLQAEGAGDLFLDFDPKRGIAAAERWRVALIDAGGRAKAVLFVITPEWLESEECRSELRFALGTQKPLLGVIAGDVSLSAIPSELTAQHQLVNLTKGTQYELFKIAPPPGYEPVEIRFSKEGLETLREGLLKLDLIGLDTPSFNWPAEGFEKETDGSPRSPWRGLQALDEPEAGVFFGRDGSLQRALDRLSELRSAGGRKLLVILGASGSGKSSFLRAGLLPRLRRLSNEYCVLPLVRPEEAVINGSHGFLSSLERLMRETGECVERATLRKEVEAGGGLLWRRLAGIQSATTKGSAESKVPTLILPLDQAEELFLPGAVEAKTFVPVLADTLFNGPEMIVIATIRTDSYAPLQGAEPLCDLQVAFSLPPISQGDYRAAIEGPADRLKAAGRNLTVDPILVDTLVAEATGADALPLLAFTMERLYRDYGGDGIIDTADYDALGRMRGAVEEAAAAAFQHPDKTPRIPADPGQRLRLLHKAFPLLVGINEENGAALRQVAKWDKIPIDARCLIERLINQRLLRSDTDDSGEVIVEVAHEALLRQWPTLTNWLNAEADNLRVIQAVQRAAAEWHDKGRTDVWLSHSSERLLTARQLQAKRAELSSKWGEVEQCYLEACERVEKERFARAARARRWITGLAISAAAIFALFGGVALWQFLIAQERAETAEIARVVALGNEARALNALAEIALERDQPLDALKLGLAAWPREKADPRPQLGAVLQITATALRMRHLELRHNKLIGVQLLKGDRVLSRSLDGTLRLWDLATGDEIGASMRHDSSVLGALISPNGRILSWSTDNTLRIWDPATGDQIGPAMKHDHWVSGAMLLDNDRILSWSRDGTLRQWDLETGAQIGPAVAHEKVVGALLMDDNVILSWSEDATLRRWDLITGEQIGPAMRHDAWVSGALPLKDGRILSWSSGDSTLRLWNPGTGTQIGASMKHDGRINGALLTRDSQILSWSDDSSLRLWDQDTGAQIGPAMKHITRVNGALLTTSGSILSWSLDGTLRLWNPATGAQIGAPLEHGGDINGALLTPNGQILSWSRQGILRLWDPLTRHQIGLAMQFDDLVLGALVTDGGRILAWSQSGAIGLWDPASGTQIGPAMRHDGWVRGARLVAGGRILSWSQDHTVRMWDQETGAQVGPALQHDLFVDGARLMKDGRILSLGRIMPCAYGIRLPVNRSARQCDTMVQYMEPYR